MEEVHLLNGEEELQEMRRNPIDLSRETTGEKIPGNKPGTYSQPLYRTVSKLI